MFYPFNFDGRRELTHLQSYIDTSNGINIVKQHGSTIKNRFWISSGLHYDNIDRENDKYFHFSIERDEYFVKKYGVLNSKSFYRDLEKKLKGYNCEVWHPDVEGTYEEIYLRCDELDTDKLNDYFDRFKTDIVIPYLRISSDHLLFASARIGVMRYLFLVFNIVIFRLSKPAQDYITLCGKYRAHKLSSRTT